MPEEVRELLSLVVRLLEIAGAGALILGFLVATLLFLRRYFREGATAAIAHGKAAHGKAAHAMHAVELHNSSNQKGLRTPSHLILPSIS